MDSVETSAVLNRQCAALEQMAAAAVAMASGGRLEVTEGEDGGARLRIVPGQPHPDQVAAEGPQVRMMANRPSETKRMGQGLPWAWIAAPYGCDVVCTPDAASPFGFRVDVVKAAPGGERVRFALLPAAPQEGEG